MTPSRPQLLYYEILDFQSDNLAFMQEHFDLIVRPDPSAVDARTAAGVDAAFAPMGYVFDRKSLQAFSRLRVLITPTTGTLHIDPDVVAEKGIRVCSLKEHTDYLQTITPTAELAWGLVLAVTRRIPSAFESVCQGRWNGKHFGALTPRMLSRMRLGIIGMGRLGRRVAVYGRAFGMPVVYHDPYRDEPGFTACDTPLDLARQSDIVSVHVHLTAETQNLVDARFIAAMQPGSFIINTARGGVVDETALLEALQSGHLAGAGLDMLAGEHLPGFRERLAGHALVSYARDHDNLVLTPKIGGATRDAWIGTERRVIEAALAALGKKEPQ